MIEYLGSGHGESYKGEVKRLAAESLSDAVFSQAITGMWPSRESLEVKYG